MKRTVFQDRFGNPVKPAIASVVIQQEIRQGKVVNSTTFRRKISDLSTKA